MSRQEVESEIARLQDEIRKCQIAREDKERAVGHLVFSLCHYCNTRTESIKALKAELKKGQ